MAFDTNSFSFGIKGFFGGVGGLSVNPDINSLFSVFKS